MKIATLILLLLHCSITVPVYGEQHHEQGNNISDNNIDIRCKVAKKTNGETSHLLHTDDKILNSFLNNSNSQIKRCDYLLITTHKLKNNASTTTKTLLKNNNETHNIKILNTRTNVEKTLFKYHKKLIREGLFSLWKALSTH